MLYTKMQGAGNDFIVIDNRSGAIPEEKQSALAARVCRRRVSVGADGLMVVQQPTMEGADYRMLFYNSDGSVGEMCGNGARCICRYGYEKGLAGETQRVQTTAGLVTGVRISGREYRVRLNDVTTLRPDLTLDTSRGPMTVSYVELGCPGLPHAVVHMPGLKDMDRDELRALGRELRWHSSFPKGANVNFWDWDGADALTEITFERGVEDFTLACGTGTGSVVSVLTAQGLVSGREVPVSMMGGVLRISVDVTGPLPKELYLTGPTTMVSEGELLDEDLAVALR